MSYSLLDLMQLVVAERGEAIHLHDGEAPVVEIGRELHRLEGPRLQPGDTLILLRSIAPPDAVREASRGFAVFDHEYDETESFQVMAFREEGTVRLELRRIT